MINHLPLEILPQPSDTSCGPTCLHAVYRYYGDAIGLEQIIAEVPTLQDGGTLAVLLGCHALRRGYRGTIYTYDLQVFDPTWFAQAEVEPRAGTPTPPGAVDQRAGTPTPPGAVDLSAKLSEQARCEDKRDARLATFTQGYLEFLALGGVVRLEDLTTALIRRYLTSGRPILTGCSATYLHRTSREFGPQGVADDIRGQPQGHFVVLCGYDKETRQVLVADPLQPNPLSATYIYLVGIERVVAAILLGIVTYDANLLILEPPRAPLPDGRGSEPGRAPLALRPDKGQ